jgi:uncharacterized SAM-binding protein YcdF (DUF218 family)
MTHPRFATVTRLPQGRTIFAAVAPAGIVLALVWLVTDVIPWGDVLVPPLEARFPATDLGEPQTIAGIVVLIGNDARLREAGRLARMYPHLHIVVSGVRASTPLAVAALLGSDINPDNITLETNSTDTYTNAKETLAFLKTQPSKRWLLITSAAHMPRAMGAFRKLGGALEPWPVRDTSHIIPRPSYVARHEWYGLVGYWLTGKTSALFPGP